MATVNPDEEKRRMELLSHMAREQAESHASGRGARGPGNVGLIVALILAAILILGPILLAALNGWQM